MLAQHHRANLPALILLAALAASASPGSAQQPESWPQWRGPARDGVAPVGPAAWPEQIVRTWSLPVGLGHSSPVVADGHVYQFSREGEDEVLRAIDLGTGAVHWDARNPAPYRVQPGAAFHGPGPKSTPVVTGGRVYTLGISGILQAVDAGNGGIVWRRQFAGEFPTTAPVFGTAMSPIVIGDLIVAHVGGERDGAIVALDAATGQDRWRWSGDGPGYASPVLVDVGDSIQLVTQTERNVVALDPVDGSLLWSLPLRTDYDQNSVTPLSFDSTILLSGLGNGIFAIRPGAGEAGPTEIWRTDEASMYMSSPVLSGQRLFGFSHLRAGQFFALDPATGEVLWTSTGREGENAAVVSLGDRVLWLTDEARLVITAANASEFAPLADYQVADSPTWAHPAVLSDGVLIKDHDTLTRWSVARNARRDRAAVGVVPGLVVGHDRRGWTRRILTGLAR